MTREKLIAIDNLFYPFYWLLKSFKAINPTKNNDASKFIIIKFFGLGSITRIVAVIEDLNIDKQAICFVTLDKNKQILNELNFECLLINTKNPLVIFGSVLQSFSQIWKRKQSTILDMERTSNLSGIYSLIAAIGKPRKYFTFHSNNSGDGISLSNKPAIQAIEEMFDSDIIVRTIRSSKKKSVLKKIMVNINAGDYLPQRRFPLVLFAELICDIQQLFPQVNFVLTGMPKEKERVDAFEQLLMDNKINASKVLNLSGALNLADYITELKEVDVLITNDSGPLHLAHFLGVRTIGIWGPTSANLVGYPNSKIMLNLKSNLPCSPCFIHPKSQVAKTCNGEVTCFKEMPIKYMVNQINQFILED
ncbi:glycosyltransferase family 9 protein [Crocinitomix catalasitica]|uniref:glycosyltransferase family 9 protein n=1 Tax=Crocinitomix catalasitica TaxID=184607 RepID=UPI00048200BF|nr:glycosyltransferase family 9 protein [Crocinitomix catalasitica]